LVGNKGSVDHSVVIPKRRKRIRLRNFKNATSVGAIGIVAVGRVAIDNAATNARGVVGIDHTNISILRVKVEKIGLWAGTLSGISGISGINVRGGVDVEDGTSRGIDRPSGVDGPCCVAWASHSGIIEIILQLHAGAQ